MQLVVALPPRLFVWRCAALTLLYTYASLCISVFGPDANARPRAVAEAAFFAALVDLHCSRSFADRLTFQPFGKSPCRTSPRRAICASLNGGATVDNGCGGVGTGVGV